MRVLLAALNPAGLARRARLVGGAGLGDAVRHARRLGLWVAMATQAGATQDEDFPGLAALVSPSGEVLRLPDWRPGTLTVEVPM